MTQLKPFRLTSLNVWVAFFSFTLDPFSSPSLSLRPVREFLHKCELGLSGLPTSKSQARSKCESNWLRRPVFSFLCHDVCHR